MNNLNPRVDAYLEAGCGRCPLGATPQCKTRKWRAELEKLRSIMLETELTEEVKWGVPCYVFQNSNVVLINAFKECCVVSFFKGSLLKDPHNVLTKPGENSQAARLLRFTDVRQITQMKSILKSYVKEAIEIEKKGMKVEFKRNPEPVPEEFQQRLNENDQLKAAFSALTPGRQRAYILHFSAPKQSATRVSRIDKCIQKILDGRSLNDY